MSGAFWTLAPAALAPPQWRVLAYGAALALGAVMATMRVMANMTVIVPCDAIEAKKATLAAAVHTGPLYMRLAREKTPIVTPRIVKPGNYSGLPDDMRLAECRIVIHCWYGKEEAQAQIQADQDASVARR